LIVTLLSSININFPLRLSLHRHTPASMYAQDHNGKHEEKYTVDMRDLASLLI